jgi:hypothetical protein
MILNMVI